ncbi:MAG TPA: flagellar basal body P-ring protein FlgI [Planctomycetota bacterium]|nr:flagellar basal body P-ring protein FlgI [Planctomycetota bacterium]
MRGWALLGCTVTVLLTAASVGAQTRIKDITRLTGERDHKVVGLGIVVGLPGTGDTPDFIPAIDALRNILMKFRGFYSDPTLLPRIQKAGNVAIVEVTATLPAYHRVGNKVDVTVSSVGTAKSLKGGILLPTPLQGSRLSDDSVYSVAEGPIFPDATSPTTGRIRNGGTIEKTLDTEVLENGAFTLLLLPLKADYTNASVIASRINTEYRRERAMLTGAGRGESLPAEIAHVLSADRVHVQVPSYYASHPFDFIGRVERLDIGRPDGEARVVIDERAKTVVADLGVHVSPAVTWHRGVKLVIEEGRTSRDLTLKEVLLVLSAAEGIELTSADMIEIVKMLNDVGALHGKLEYR